MKSLITNFFIPVVHVFDAVNMMLYLPVMESVENY